MALSSAMESFAVYEVASSPFSLDFVFPHWIEDDHFQTVRGGYNYLKAQFFTQHLDDAGDVDANLAIMEIVKEATDPKVIEKVMKDVRRTDAGLQLWIIESEAILGRVAASRFADQESRALLCAIKAPIEYRSATDAKMGTTCRQGRWQGANYYGIILSRWAGFCQEADPSLAELPAAAPEPVPEWAKVFQPRPKLVLAPPKPKIAPKGRFSVLAVEDE